MTPPPGDLRWLSILWGIGAIAGVYLSIKIGMVVLGLISGVVLVASVGLWFQSHAARYVLIGWFSVASLLAVLFLAIKGFEARHLLQGLGSVYSVYELARNRED